MIINLRRLMLPLCLLLPSLFCSAQTLRIAVPDYPPYTAIEDGKLSGEGYDALLAIMARLPVKLHIVPVPNFGRATVDMQNNLLDGLYLATQSNERNALAIYSEPLFVADWSWVWLKQRSDLRPGTEAFKQGAQIAAQMNSNIYRWLKQQGFHVMAGTNSVRGLLNLLNFRRVDAIMLPKSTAIALISQTEHDISQYNIQHEIDLAFGFYISKHYAATWPDIMPALNNAIIDYQATKKTTQEQLEFMREAALPETQQQAQSACCH